MNGMHNTAGDSERIERIPVKRRPRVTISVPESELELISVEVPDHGGVATEEHQDPTLLHDTSPSYAEEPQLLSDPGELPSEADIGRTDTPDTSETDKDALKEDEKESGLEEKRDKDKAFQDDKGHQPSDEQIFLDIPTEGFGSDRSGEPLDGQPSITPDVDTDIDVLQAGGGSDEPHPEKKNPFQDDSSDLPTGSWPTFDDDDKNKSPNTSDPFKSDSLLDNPLIDLPVPVVDDEKQRNPFADDLNNKYPTSLDNRNDTGKSPQAKNNSDPNWVTFGDSEPDLLKDGEKGGGKTHSDTSKDKAGKPPVDKQNPMDRDAGEPSVIVVMQPGAATDPRFSVGTASPEDQRPGDLEREGSKTSLADTAALLPRHDQWSTGLCQCATNCPEVCYANTCLPCSIYELASVMRQTDTRSPVCCLQCYLGDLRTRLRHIYNIQGNDDSDCCISYWCSPCSIGQMRRELRIRGSTGS